MDEAASKAFFLEDLQKLRGLTDGLPITDLLVVGDRTVTYRFRWCDRRLRVVYRGAVDYPLSPTSVRFTALDDLLDDSSPNWPQGVNGINPAERFVCILGVLEGHQHHSDWTKVTEKNRFPDLTFRLLGLFDGAQRDD